MESFTAANPKCDHPTVIQNIDVTRYVGIWYDQQHTADVWYLNDSDVCGEVEYTDLEDKEFKVYNTSQSEDYGERKGIHGKATCPGTDGNCFVDFGSGYP